MKTLLYFWIEGCAPCEKYKPLARALAEETGAELRFVNAHEEPALKDQYRVKAAPTLIVLNEDGSVGGRQYGGLISEDLLRRQLS